MAIERGEVGGGGACSLLLRAEGAQRPRRTLILSLSAIELRESVPIINARNNEIGLIHCMERVSLFRAICHIRTGTGRKLLRTDDVSIGPQSHFSASQSTVFTPEIDASRLSDFSVSI